VLCAHLVAVKLGITLVLLLTAGCLDLEGGGGKVKAASAARGWTLCVHTEHMMPVAWCCQ
jgi:hypothetical protein